MTHKFFYTRTTAYHRPIGLANRPAALPANRWEGLSDLRLVACPFGGPLGPFGPKRRPVGHTGAFGAVAIIFALPIALPIWAWYNSTGQICKYLRRLIMAQRRLKFSEQIRRAIDGCGKTRYRLAQETGIDESLLSRFMRGKCNLSLKLVDKLAQNIGFSVQVPTKRK